MLQQFHDVKRLKDGVEFPPENAVVDGVVSSESDAAPALRLIVLLVFRLTDATRVAQLHAELFNSRLHSWRVRFAPEWRRC